MVVPSTSSPWQRAQFRLNCFHPSYTASADRVLGRLVVGVTQLRRLGRRVAAALAVACVGRVLQRPPRAPDAGVGAAAWAAWAVRAACGAAAAAAGSAWRVRGRRPLGVRVGSRRRLAAGVGRGAPGRRAAVLGALVSVAPRTRLVSVGGIAAESWRRRRAARVRAGGRPGPIAAARREQARAEQRGRRQRVLCSEAMEPSFPGWGTGGRNPARSKSAPKMKPASGNRPVTPRHPRAPARRRRNYLPRHDDSSRTCVTLGPGAAPLHRSTPRRTCGRPCAASARPPARGAQIVCLQELFRSQYFCQVEDHQFFDLAEPIPGPVDRGAGRARARSSGVVIVASLFEKRAEGLYHNTAAIIDADGRYLGKYRKMHIPDDPQYYEKFYFTPGDLGFRSWDTRFGRIGVLVCWDQWYPEAARLTALTGAQILFYPTAIGWLPPEKAEHGAQQQSAWETIQRSHAIANGVYVCAVNRVGHEGDADRRHRVLGRQLRGRPRAAASW